MMSLLQKWGDEGQINWTADCAEGGQLWEVNGRIGEERKPRQPAATWEGGFQSSYSKPPRHREPQLEVTTSALQFAERAVHTGMRGRGSRRQCASSSGTVKLHLFPSPERQASHRMEKCSRGFTLQKGLSVIPPSLVTSPMPRSSLQCCWSRRKMRKILFSLKLICHTFFNNLKNQLSNLGFPPLQLTC